MRSAIRNILDEGVVVGHMQRAAIRVVVHPFVIKAVFDALLHDDTLTAPIATFVLNYI